MSTRMAAPARRKSKAPRVFGVLLVLAAALGGAWAAGWIDLARLRNLVGGGGDTAATAAAPRRTSERAAAEPTPPPVTPPPADLGAVGAPAPAPRGGRQAPQAPAQAEPAEGGAPVEPQPIPRVVVGPPVITPNDALTGVDLAADSLERAVRMYRDVASRGTPCDALARLRRVVDDWVTKYNIAKNESGAALDDPRTARDQSLYAGADSVDLHFRRAGCPSS